MALKHFIKREIWPVRLSRTAVYPASIVLFYVCILEYLFIASHLIIPTHISSFPSCFFANIIQPSAVGESSTSWISSIKKSHFTKEVNVLELYDDLIFISVFFLFPNKISK